MWSLLTLRPIRDLLFVRVSSEENLADRPSRGQEPWPLAGQRFSNLGVWRRKLPVIPKFLIDAGFTVEHLKRKLSHWQPTLCYCWRWFSCSFHLAYVSLSFIITMRLGELRTPGLGNCLFSAVALCLKAQDIRTTSKELRKLACVQLQKGAANAFLPTGELKDYQSRVITLIFNVFSQIHSPT